MDQNVKNRSDITVVLVFFISLAIVGFLAGGFIVRDYAKARASAAWPTAEGVVLSKRANDRARVRYAYSVNGRSFESSRERVFTARFGRSTTEVYAPGQNVTVYFNPQMPNFSVLQPGGAGLAFVLLSLVSGACVFFGVGGVVWTLSETIAHEASAPA